MQGIIRRSKNTQGQIEYSKYRMNLREYVKWFVLIFMAAGIFAYVFYKSIIALVIFMLPIYYYMKLVSEYLRKKRTKILMYQFKEVCMSMRAQLLAGYSLENSIDESYVEMEQLYGKNSYICQELLMISAKMKINITIEKCFEEFAGRSNVEEIRLFAEVIKMAKRSGGDIIEIVRNAADSISEKIELEREISTIINSKKYEQMVMNIVPLLIVIYVDLTSHSMMSVMYECILGRVVMTICLIMYVISFMWGMRIIKIDI